MEESADAGRQASMSVFPNSAWENSSSPYWRQKTEACVSEMALLLSTVLKADILYLHNLKVMFKGHYFASLVNKTLLLDIGEHERNQSFMLPESTIQV